MGWYGYCCKLWDAPTKSKTAKRKQQMLFTVENSNIRSVDENNFKFFAATVKIINSFLVKFQTNNPVVPFLAQAIQQTMCLFGSSFLLKVTLRKSNTCLCLSNLNFKNPSLHKCPGDVDPGIGVKLKLSILRKKGKINENQGVEFQKGCCQFSVKDMHPSCRKVTNQARSSQTF